MPEFICPNCRGGFPEAVLDSCCPWCEQPLNGSYEVPEPPQRVSKVVKDSENDGKRTGLLSIFQ